MKRRYFDDLRDGEHLHCQPVVMTREAIIDFAKKNDPQLFHIDENAASESFFIGRIDFSGDFLYCCFFSWILLYEPWN